ncbi:MAG: molybdopterin-dependent oxidoreductase [Thermoleophilia bacterium]|nr:molybdopterin-dependent oxidoreductase [Thermoleophilia bacterium]
MADQPNVYQGRNQDRQEFRVVGRRDLPGRLSYALASGSAVFAREYVCDGMLHAKVLRSPYGRARIKRLDVSKAMALPGVHEIVTWEDEELRLMESRLQPHIEQMMSFITAFPGFLLSNQADREGEEVGACVAAESEEVCDEAISLLDIEWEIQPHVLTAEEALRPDAPVLQPDLHPDNIAAEYSWEIGNVREGFAQADHIIEYDRAYPFINTHKPNPYTMVAWWEQDMYGDKGESLYVYSDTFNADQHWLSVAFALPEDKIHWLNMFMGGQYCDFIMRRLTFLTPLLAKRTGRPVRMAFTRRDAFDCGGDSSDTTHMKVGFTSDGIIVAAEGHIISNVGTRGPKEIVHSIEPFNTTRCPNIRSKAVAVHTSTTRRGLDHSHPPNWEVLTTAIWRISDFLGMDPIEVSLKNCHTPEPSLKLCIEIGKAAFGWEEKWHTAGTRRLPNGKMHGVAFRYHDAPRHSHANYSCTIAIRADGKVYVPSRGPWRGVYCDDAVAMVVAEELGALPEDVIIKYDMWASFTSQGGGSDGGAASTWVAKEAAIDLKALLLAEAARKLGGKPDDYDTRDSRVYLKSDPNRHWGFEYFVIDPATGWQRDLVATYTGQPPGSVWFVMPRYSVLNTMSVVFCEVEVDTETGDVDITRWVVVHDAGKAIRPSSIEGNIEGMIIAGTGTAKMEELVWDKDTGVLLNGNDLEYKIPTIMDVGEIEPIIVETRTGNGCYGATGIGHSIVDKGLVACAVQNAIGVWIDDLPITPAKVLKALGKI